MTKRRWRRWVFHPKEQQRRTASLELLATLLGVMVFRPGRPSAGAGSISATPSGTDNKGNGHLLDKMITGW